jgi:ABC-2 type transport system permease protein
MSGTVFDIGYQNYTGAREGRDRSQRAVFKDGVRISLGFGRGVRAKILPWFFIAILCGIALVMALVAGAAERLGGPGAAQEMNLPSHADYYGIASILIFVFSALVAPELLCRDRREGTINLYLVRPLTGADYVLSRWAAFLAVTIVAAWLPQIILFLGLSMGDPDPVNYLRHHWLDIPRFLGAGMAMAAYATSLAMLTASFTTRRAYASVFLVGLFVISTPFTVGLASELDNKAASGSRCSISATSRFT